MKTFIVLLVRTYQAVATALPGFTVSLILIGAMIAHAQTASAAPEFTPDMMRYNMAKQFRASAGMLLLGNPNFQGLGRIRGRQDPNGQSCGQIPTNQEECELLQYDAYVKICVTTLEFQSLAVLKSYPVCNGQGRGLQTFETWCACDY